MGYNDINNVGPHVPPGLSDKKYDLEIQRLEKLLKKH